MTLNDAPGLETIEVSLFGPGLGESIAIHYGGGRWIVVDSCIDPESGSVASLEYFERIGVNGSAVTHVVATHAHDDHIKGLSNVLTACDRARFVCPAAMVREQFASLLGADAELEGLRRSALREFRQIHDILESRRNPSNRLGSYLYGIEGRMLLSESKSGQEPSIRIQALTPSDTALTRSLTKLARLFPTKGPKKRLRDLPNETSLALWIEIGTISVILGSDLEEGPNDCGWKGVMAWPDRPGTRSDLFKVSHHGSHTGHHAPMWDTMLVDAPVSILTPFQNGSVSLPTEDDLRRIAGASARTFITVAPRETELTGAVRAISSSLGGLVENRRVKPQTMGHVRLRRGLQTGSEWEGATDHPATEIEITPANEIPEREPLPKVTRNKSKKRAEAKTKRRRRDK